MKKSLEILFLMTTFVLGSLNLSASSRAGSADQKKFEGLLAYMKEQANQAEAEQGKEEKALRKAAKNKRRNRKKRKKRKAKKATERLRESSDISGVESFLEKVFIDHERSVMDLDELKKFSGVMEEPGGFNKIIEKSSSFEGLKYFFINHARKDLVINQAYLTHNLGEAEAYKILIEAYLKNKGGERIEARDKELLSLLDKAKSFLSGWKKNLLTEKLKARKRREQVPSENQVIINYTNFILDKRFKLFAEGIQEDPCS